MMFILLMMIMPDLSDEFRKGQRVDLVSGWKVRFVIASGILEMLKNVVNSNEIIGKPVIWVFIFNDAT
jgi:hypothetical protein